MYQNCKIFGCRFCPFACWRHFKEEILFPTLPEIPCREYQWHNQCIDTLHLYQYGIFLSVDIEWHPCYWENYYSQILQRFNKCWQYNYIYVTVDTTSIQLAYWTLPTGHRLWMLRFPHWLLIVALLWDMMLPNMPKEWEYEVKTSNVILLNMVVF